MIPKISVIVPVWNRENLIERCLESILNQSHRPDELIVVDNGSTDSTLRRVKNWMERNSGSGIKLKLLEEERKGAALARQKGLLNAQGDYLSFFDSDDEMHPDLIEKALRKLNENKSSDIVCWKCRLHLLDGSKRVPPFLPDNPVEGHLIHTLLRPQGYIVKKDFLIEAGGWSKPIEVWNDLELGLRLILKNPEIVSLDEILAEIYSQPDSITGKDFSSKQGKWETTLAEMERENNLSGYKGKKRIRKIINYRKSILAAQYHRERNYAASLKLLLDCSKGSSLIEKMIFKFSFYFTKMGLRGAWRIARFGL